MNNYVDDPVFGHMEYHHRWYKTDEYEIFGKKWRLSVVAKAYLGKSITEAEKDSYKKFQENKQTTLSFQSVIAILSGCDSKFAFIGFREMVIVCEACRFSDCRDRHIRFDQ